MFPGTGPVDATIRLDTNRKLISDLDTVPCDKLNVAVYQNYDQYIRS